MILYYIILYYIILYYIILYYITIIYLLRKSKPNTVPCWKKLSIHSLDLVAVSMRDPNLEEPRPFDEARRSVIIEKPGRLRAVTLLSDIKHFRTLNKLGLKSFHLFYRINFVETDLFLLGSGFANQRTRLMRQSKR